MSLNVYQFLIFKVQKRSQKTKQSKCYQGEICVYWGEIFYQGETVSNDHNILSTIVERMLWGKSCYSFGRKTLWAEWKSCFIKGKNMEWDFIIVKPNGKQEFCEGRKMFYCVWKTKQFWNKRRAISICHRSEQIPENLANLDIQKTNTS